MANLSTIITGQTPLGGATEKNYVQASDAPGALWVASGAGVAVSLETAVGNLPESTTKKSAIKILRASGADYVRYRFVIDKVDGSKTFKIQWAQSYAGAAGDYTLSVVAFTDSGYSVSAGTLPVTVTNIPAINGVWTVTFNTLAFVTAPYLEVRINAISATTPLYLSGVLIGPGIVTQGAVTSDWQSYTPTLGASLTASVNNARWRRVGSSMEIIASITASNTGAVAAFTVALPSTYTIDAAALPRGLIAVQEIGKGRFYNATTSDLLDPYPLSSTTIAFVRRGTNNSDLNGNAIISGYTVDFRVVVPIAEWTGNGVVTLSSGAIVEYASNSSTTITTDITSFATGSAGSLMPTGTAAGLFAKRVRFTYPIQSDDQLVLEVKKSTGSWLAVENVAGSDGLQPLLYQNGVTYGMGVNINAVNSTDVDVQFGQYYFPSGTTYGAAGNNWSSLAAGYSWRLRKSKASAPVGIDTSALGGGSSGFALSLKTSSFTAATLSHYLVDTTSTTVTATLPAGAVSAAIKFSDDQRTWSVRPLTITPSTGERIDGQVVNETFVCDVSGATIQLSWDGTRWVLDSNVLTNNISITTGNTLTEKNYVTRPDAAATDWFTSNAGQVTVTTETTTGNLPENATKTTAIKVLRSAGTTSYVYTRFVVDSADANKKFKLQWNQKFAGAAGDFTIALFSFTASDYTTGSTQLTSLQTSTVSVLATGSFVTSFDVPGTAAPYLELRIIAAAGTTPLYLSGVVVGPGVSTQGAVISEWTAYTPTYSNSTNVTQNDCRWRRVGSNMEIHTNISWTGTGAGGTFQVNIPVGYTMNTTNQDSANTVGSGIHFANAATTRTSITVAISTTTAFTFARTIGTSFSYNGTDFTTNDRLSFNAFVPINEWASNGTVTLGPGAQVEYTSVAMTSDANLTTTVYGPAGSRTPTVTLTTTRYAEVTWQYPRQQDDAFFLEVDFNGDGRWIPHDANEYGTLAYQNQNATSYGMYMDHQTDPYKTRVRFTQYTYPNGTTYGSAGALWTAAATMRWRIRKVRPNTPVGFGMAGTDGSSGLYQAGRAPGLTTGVAIATGYIGETLVSSRLRSLATNVSSAVTIGQTGGITLTAGTWSISAMVGCSVTSGTTVNASVSKVNNTLSGTDTLAYPTAGEIRAQISFASATVENTLAIAPYTYSVSTSTPIYLVVSANGSSPTAYGFLQAVRIA